MCVFVFMCVVSVCVCVCVIVGAGEYARAILCNGGLTNPAKGGWGVQDAIHVLLD